MERPLESPASFLFFSKGKSSWSALLKAEETGGCGVPQRTTTALIRDGASAKVSELLLVAYFRVVYIVKMNHIVTLVYMKYDTTLVESERVLCKFFAFYYSYSFA